ncbi:HTH domain-containing protein [Candidatus Micrarchaeota archaeon]|nr:HTH domain-containing protein [Candidatus Micrarchaeota archaeon]
MLSKKEIVYRDILERWLEGHQTRFTQLELSKKFSISLSTVSNALSPLRAMGAIDVRARHFELVDAKKTMLYWATIRGLGKDTAYSTRYEAPPGEIERLMPAGVSFTAFSAYRFMYKDAPADYSEVYAYADTAALDEARRRFPPAAGPPNVFVLKADPFIRKGVVSAPQAFVDLWNLRTWYARDFADALERRMFG